MTPRRIILALALLGACVHEPDPAPGGPPQTRMEHCLDAIDLAYELGCDETNAERWACWEPVYEGAPLPEGECAAEDAAATECLRAFGYTPGREAAWCVGRCDGGDEFALETCLESETWEFEGWKDAPRG